MPIEQEIKQSQDVLEDNANGRVTSFAYPHGYMRETLAVIREAGFSIGCSSEDGSVWRGNNPFLLASDRDP
jgi:hypothetical protein